MAIGEDFKLEDSLGQMSRLPAQLRYLILGVVFVLVCTGYYFAVHAGQQQQLQGLQANLTQLQQDIQKGRAVESNLQSFEKEQEMLRAKLAEALTRLPNEKELPVLLTDISSLGKKAGLEFRSFKPNEEINRGFYAEVPINIEVIGAYHDIGIFFDRIARLSRIVNITDLEINVSNHGSANPQLNVKGTAATFRFIDNATQSAQQAGGV